MSDALAASCADLATWLPVAQALTSEPDTDGTTGGGKPGSRPPWNPAAANATMDAHAGVRHTELTMRLEAGLPPRRRGGSDANTMAAITAIVALASAVPDAATAQAARDLDRLTRRIQELPAVDEAEPWIQVQGATCPYCEMEMLRLARRAGRVACLRGGICLDRDGQPPAGLVQQSAFGVPMVAWNDGYTQYGAVDHGEVAP